MFEVKSHSFVVDGIKSITKGVMHYFIEQSYMEHTWTLIAYNILSKFIVDNQLSTIVPEPSNIYLHEKVPNSIRVQCNVFPSIGIEQGVIDATHEFELYRGNTKIEEVMFHTVYLKTDFTNDIRNLIIKNLMQGIIGDKKKTILLAIVTPDMDWHIGIITMEEIQRVYKFAATGIGIQVNIYQNREDVLDLLREF
ncbi:hypothetical protein [Lysinibacillus fusiformis]|uniref:hypothetical protein n=1 Tax=Lysinibacillus fusiformis TaxID=28031 RepID=UPI003CF8E8D3